MNVEKKPPALGNLNEFLHPGGECQNLNQLVVCVCVCVCCVLWLSYVFVTKWFACIRIKCILFLFTLFRLFLFCLFLYSLLLLCLVWFWVWHAIMLVPTWKLEMSLNFELHCILVCFCLIICFFIWFVLFCLTHVVCSGQAPASFTLAPFTTNIRVALTQHSYVVRFLLTKNRPSISVCARPFFNISCSVRWYVPWFISSRHTPNAESAPSTARRRHMLSSRIKHRIGALNLTQASHTLVAPTRRTWSSHRRVAGTLSTTYL